METRICFVCGINKPLNIINYAKNSCGWKGTCRICKSKKTKTGRLHHKYDPDYKEIYKCGCGCMVKWMRKNRHLKSKRHMNYLKDCCVNCGNIGYITEDNRDLGNCTPDCVKCHTMLCGICAEHGDINSLEELECGKGYGCNK